MKLNPLKCEFEVSSGKFLGFMETERRIEAHPIQLKSIMESQAHTTDSCHSRYAESTKFIS